jgi:hypothetical protein
MGADALQVETQVTTLPRRHADKERRYTVFTQSAAALAGADAVSPAEAGPEGADAGRRLLAADARQPAALRITPSQKLLGDASTGDIAT